MKLVLVLVLILLAALAVAKVVVVWSDRQVVASVLAPRPDRLRDDLPGIVADFARRGLAGAAPAAGCRITQTVEMRLKPGADWTPMTAWQVIAARQPGFAWIARMGPGPLTLVRVIDSYGPDGGRLAVRALGAVPIGTSTGPEADRDEAMRYLAELPWCPDAILSNPDLRWQVLDATRVAVEVDTPGGVARVELLFDAAGDIAGARADERETTDADGAKVRLPWRGTFSDYREIGGRRIPARGEVGYLRPGGYEAYWRGTITDLVPISGAF